VAKSGVASALQRDGRKRLLLPFLCHTGLDDVDLGLVLRLVVWLGSDGAIEAAAVVHAGVNVTQEVCGSAGCATGIEFNLDLAEFGGEYDATGWGPGRSASRMSSVNIGRERF
jgi:hypothetical protein